MAITVPVWVVQSVLAGRSPVTYHGFLEDLSAAAGMTLQEVSAEAYQAAPYGLILVATGGSEEMCRTLLDQGVDHPVYLLTYGDGVSDVKSGLGLVAPRVMLCASHQALTVLRILAGEYEV